MNEELSKLIDELVAKGATDEEIDIIVRDYQSKQQKPSGGAGFQNFKTAGPQFLQDAGDVISSFNRGATQFIPDILRLEGAIESTLGVKPPIQTVAELTGLAPETQNWNLALADRIESFISEANPVTPEFQESTAGQVAQGVGQVVPFLMTGGTSGAVQEISQVPKVLSTAETVLASTKAAGRQLASPAGIIGGSMVASPEWEAAKAQGMSDEEALAVLAQNYLVGQTEVIPIQKVLGRLNNITGGNLVEIAKAAGTGAFTEGVQEAFQTYLTNQIASGSYDPDRDPLFQVIESAKVGGLVGMLIPAVGVVASKSSPEVADALNRKVASLQIDQTIETSAPAGDLSQSIDSQVQQTVNTIQDAQKIREDQGVIPQTGQAPEGGQETSRDDIQFPAQAGAETSNTQIPITNEEEVQKEGIEKGRKGRDENVGQVLQETREDGGQEVVQQDEGQLQPVDPIQAATDFNSSGFLTGAGKEAVGQIAEFARGKFNKRSQFYEFVDAFNEQSERKISDKEALDSWNQIREIKVKEAQPTITMPVNEALKKQVKDFYRGVERGVKRGSEIINTQLIPKVQEALKTADLSPQQTSSILSRLKRTNLFTPGSFSKLNTYIDKVVQDAQYAERLDSAEGLRKRIKNLSKTSQAIPQNLKRTAREFATIDPQSVASLDDYIEKANVIVNGFSTPKGQRYEPINEAEVYNLINEVKQKEEAELLRQEIGDLTEDEINEIIEMGESVDQFLANKAEAKRIEILDQLSKKTEYAKIGLEEAIPILPVEDQASVTELLDINPSEMTADDMITYIRVADNIVLNGDLSGINDVKVKIRAAKNIKTLKDITKGYRGRLTSVLKSIQSLPQIFDAIYNSQKIAADVQYYSGIAETLDAGSRVENDYEQKKEQLADAIDKIGTKYKKDMRSLEEQGKVMILSEMAKYYGDPKKSITQVKNNIKRSIEMYRKEDPKLAEALSKSFSPYESVESSEQVVEAFQEKDPQTVEAWQWLRDNVFTPEFYTRFKKSTEQNHNKRLLEFENYIPTVQTKIDRAAPSTTEEQYLSAKTLKPRASKSTIDPTRRLMTGGAYNLNFFDGVMKSYRSSNYDIESTEARKLVHEITKRPEFEEVIGGIENKRKIIDEWQKRDAEQRGVFDRTDHAMKLINEAVGGFRELGSAIALGGFDQVALQYVPGFLSAHTILGKDAGLLWTHIPTEFDKVYEQHRISQRGARLGGVDIGDTSKFELNSEKVRRAERFIEKFRQRTGAFARFKLAPLRWSDVNLARRTWASYYLKSLKDQGVDLKTVDLKTESTKQREETRKKAAAFADQMVSSTQVPSNTAELSDFARSRGTAGFVRNLLFSFSVFPLNMKIRMQRAIDKMAAGPEGSKIEGAKELSSVLAESALFAGMKVYVLGYLYYPLLEKMWRELSGADEPEEDEKASEKASRKFWTGISDDMIPFSIGAGQKYSRDFVNRSAYLARGEEYKDLRYEDWLKETGGAVNQAYEGDFSDLGLYGIGAQKISDVYESMSNAVNVAQGDDTIYYNTIYGEAEAPVDGKEDMVYLHALIDALSTVTPIPRELTSTERKVYREQLKTNKSGRRRRMQYIE